MFDDFVEILMNIIGAVAAVLFIMLSGYLLIDLFKGILNV